MTLELDNHEANVLLQLVKRRINEIGPEIHHTDKRGFRKELAKDEDCLRSIHDRLATVACDAT